MKRIINEPISLDYNLIFCLMIIAAALIVTVGAGNTQFIVPGALEHPIIAAG